MIRIQKKYFLNLFIGEGNSYILIVDNIDLSSFVLFRNLFLFFFQEVKNVKDGKTSSISKELSSEDLNALKKALEDIVKVSITSLFIFMKY